jgi:hypothetical protein
MRPVVATVLALSLASAFAQQALTGDDAAFAAAFVCPEHLPNDQARDASTRAFITWVKKHHPDWVLGQLVDWRLYLLESHH